jgi:hypothetical protein
VLALALPLAVGMSGPEALLRAAASAAASGRMKRGKYLAHDRKVYAPAGDSSATAAVGPMSCPARHNEAMRMPVAENYVVLSARNRP